MWIEGRQKKWCDVILHIGGEIEEGILCIEKRY